MWLRHAFIMTLSPCSLVGGSSAVLRPGSIFTVMGHILQKEQLFGLWRGVTPVSKFCVEYDHDVSFKFDHMWKKLFQRSTKLCDSFSALCIHFANVCFLSSQ